MDDFDQLDALLELCSKAEDAFLAADAALEANPSDPEAQAAFDAAEAAFDRARAKYDACAKAMMEAASESGQAWAAALASYELGRMSGLLFRMARTSIRERGRVAEVISETGLRLVAVNTRHRARGEYDAQAVYERDAHYQGEGQGPWAAALASYERDAHYCGLTLSDMLRSRE